MPRTPKPKPKVKKEESSRPAPPPKPFPRVRPPQASARQRVLAQWRGVDVAPLEVAQSLRARQAGAVMSGLLKDLRIDGRRAEAEVVKVWNDLLDPAIVAHAQPTGLRKGTLFVTVDSSVWLSEIVRYRRKEILDRLQHSFGPTLIQKISYRVG
jgi:predicted nucleic acid-binding Zn ribbon protein